MLVANGPRLIGQSNADFSSVPGPEVPRSQFNRSHGYKTAFDAGYLVPVFVDEVLPGDTCSLSMTTFARMATPKTPVMDNLYCDVFFFFVPNRLVWTNWERMNGAQDNPTDSTDYLVPHITSTAIGSGGYAIGSIHDYMGLPTGVDSYNHSALWHRAYNLIWNEWFRDQNLQNSVTVNKGDGPDSPSTYTLLKRGKRHDYFTSSLPWPQKGPAVELPLGMSAPVVANGSAPVFTSAHSGTDRNLEWTGAANNPIRGSGATIAFNETLSFGAQTGLQTDLSSATAATINQLRESFQLQKLFERDARGGTRYIEILKAHFGVISPDFRLQRPEYLGGGSTMINMSPIPQTSSTDATTPQGNLAAMGTFSHSGVGFSKSFVEHGVLIGLVNVRADLNYQQGLNRMWSRETRYDFYWPAFSHLGEQTVLNKEIYCQGAAGGADDDLVFGYQERYAEYRYKPSQITGIFRSTAASTLDSWHLAQKFTSLPVLNSTFIQENPPIDRVVAVPSQPDFLFDAAFTYKCARPMPVRSVPGLIDHF